jgi:hypothetical protein
MGEFSFEITKGDEMLYASDSLHGLFTEGKDWNELIDMIVEAIYSHKSNEYKVCFNYIPEPGEENAVLAAIERDFKLSKNPKKRKI